MNIIHYVIPIEESIIDAFFICEKRERASMNWHPQRSEGVLYGKFLRNIYATTV